jgi:Dyp-type peroxidase family
MPPTLPLHDIQGLLRSAYSHLECAAYKLVRVTDPPAARASISNLATAVTTAEGKREHDSLNVAFTAAGLSRLGLTGQTLKTFPIGFQEGMASPRRSRVLGDRGANDPARWEWGGPNTEEIHALILLFAEDEARLATLSAEASERLAGFTTLKTLGAGRQPDSREHFGFRDGVGQPAIDGMERAEAQRARTGHVTVLPPGEFVLGYTNIYGAMTPVPDIAGPGAAAPPTGGNDTRTAFGSNGTYLVFRQVEQNVPAFWQFAQQAGSTIYQGDANAATRLAAKMVGRWPSGAPLVLYPDSDPLAGTPTTTDSNNFQYAAHDQDGVRCPFGSHIRRSNPRDALGPDPATARNTANRHRILRRGRSYGDRIQNPSEDDGKTRGLHFICLNADLERQFEFVQQTWVDNPVFAGLYFETDPLIGHRGDGDTFSVQSRLLRQRAHGLTAFVTIRGGGYFFLPGIQALKTLGAR